LLFEQNEQFKRRRICGKNIKIKKLKIYRICFNCKKSFNEINTNNQIYCNNCLKLEMRTCICGCDKTFECRIKEKRKFINGHGGRVSREERTCACGWRLGAEPTYYTTVSITIEKVDE